MKKIAIILFSFLVTNFLGACSNSVDIDGEVYVGQNEKAKKLTNVTINILTETQLSEHIDKKKKEIPAEIRELKRDLEKVKKIINKIEFYEASLDKSINNYNRAIESQISTLTLSITKSAEIRSRMRAGLDTAVMEHKLKNSELDAEQKVLDANYELKLAIFDIIEKSPIEIQKELQERIIAFDQNKGAIEEYRKIASERLENLAEEISSINNELKQSETGVSSKLLSSSVKIEGAVKVMTNVDGKFKLKLNEGKYALIASADKYVWLFWINASSESNQIILNDKNASKSNVFSAY